MPYDELAAEVVTEVRLLRAIQGELATHAVAREQRYRQVDPGQLARSLPGFAEISAPVLVAVMGRPGRFRDGTRFKSYAGLAPRASETGDTDRKGQPMSKAGPLSAAGHTVPRRGHPPPPRPAAGQDLLPADDRTRRHLPQSLLRRRRAPRRTSLWTVLHRGTPYVICDNNGNPVTPAEARQIIAERWTVPEDIRKRRRSRKMAGKVPQAATTGPHRRGDPPRPRSSRPRTQAVKPLT